MNVPVAGVHEFASVTLYAKFTPAACVNIPVALVTPSKVYDNGAVPPDAIIDTVAVPPLHAIVDCETLLTETTVGTTTIIVAHVVALQVPEYLT